MASGQPIDLPPAEDNIPPLVDDHGTVREVSLKKSLLRKAATHHERVPGLRRMPLPALGIILLLVIVNLVVWVGVGIVLVWTAIHC